MNRCIMDFVNEIRRAETTNAVESKLVWYEQKLIPILDKLNTAPKRERLMILTSLIQELLACTNTTPIEKLGIIEYVKGKL